MQVLHVHSFLNDDKIVEVIMLNNTSMQSSKAVVSKSSGSIPYDAMIHLVSILYCRSIFHDFRMPVEILYPTLATSYLSIIQSPMDHGTLLVKLLKNEIKTIDDFRR